MRHRTIKLLSTIAMLHLVAGSAGAAAPTTRPLAVYPGGDEALLNRLNAALFVRTDKHGQSVGEDEIDPLLWFNTQHLTTGPSNDQAIALLDELTTKPLDAITPLQRAVLQHDLWTAFDWASQHAVVNEDDADHPAEAAGRRKLRARLATAIHRIALPAADIAKLPDNYRAAVATKQFARQFDPAKPDAPFLPPDLLDPAGPWVCVNPLRTRGVAAPDHASAFGARSAFLVFINLPGGRRDTEAYLNKLSSTPNPTTRRSRDDWLTLTRDIPQFPAGTQVALLRQMFLIDATGRIVATPVTISLQLRVYRTIGNAGDMVAGRMRFLEFQLSRRDLFANGHGLSPVGADHKTYSFFGLLGQDDPFESTDLTARRPVTTGTKTLQTCAGCHVASGIYSVNSFSKQNSEAKPDPHLLPTTPSEETSRAVWLKSQQRDFGLLQGLMEARK